MASSNAATDRLRRPTSRAIRATGGCEPRVKIPNVGRSGIGLLAFAILALVLLAVVATIAFTVGHQVAGAQRALGLLP